MLVHSLTSIEGVAHRGLSEMEFEDSRPELMSLPGEGGMLEDKRSIKKVLS